MLLMDHFKMKVKHHKLEACVTNLAVQIGDMSSSYISLLTMLYSRQDHKPLIRCYQCINSYQRLINYQVHLYELVLEGRSRARVPTCGILLAFVVVHMHGLEERREVILKLLLYLKFSLD